MFEIIAMNAGFWFNFAIPFVIALYLVITNREYIWKEFGIQVGATFTYLAIIYSALFYTTTDLMDKEYWNGKVAKFEYYEEWKEEVTYTESYSCGTSKNPRTCTRTKTRIDYHAPYYRIITSNGEKISITKSDYFKASREFGHKEKDIYRSNQVSFGDGDMYISYPNKIIPTSVGHTYENYVKASKLNVIKEKQNKQITDKMVKDGLIRPYPKTYKSEYGTQKLDRIIDTTGTANKKVLREKLDKYSAMLGKTKQVNPVIYITNEPIGFKAYLKSAWDGAKKNDAILVLGVNDEGVVQWSDVITWTNNTDFEVDCGNKFKNMSVKKDTIVTEFSKLIRESYVRKPYKEFEYLKENISLDWYWQLFILLGNIGLSGFIFYKFLNNYDRKFGKNWQ
jgi:hypothetical protein